MHYIPLGVNHNSYRLQFKPSAKKHPRIANTYTYCNNSESMAMVYTHIHTCIYSIFLNRTWKECKPCHVKLLLNSIQTLAKYHNVHNAQQNVTTIITQKDTVPSPSKNALALMTQPTTPAAATYTHTYTTWCVPPKGVHATIAFLP